jgi:hypothetical protein
MGDVNTTLKLLLEMLAHGKDMSIFNTFFTKEVSDLGKDEEPTTLQEDLVAVLHVRTRWIPVRCFTHGVPEHSPIHR